MLWGWPQADQRVWQSVSSGERGFWAALAFSPALGFVPGFAHSSGHSAPFLAASIALAAALHAAMWLAWRRHWVPAPAFERFVPWVTLLLLAGTIVSGGAKFPLPWVAVYLYAPLLAHVYRRNAT